MGASSQWIKSKWSEVDAHVGKWCLHDRGTCLCGTPGSVRVFLCFYKSSHCRLWKPFKFYFSSILFQKPERKKRFNGWISLYAVDWHVLVKEALVVNKSKIIRFQPFLLPFLTFRTPQEPADRQLTPGDIVVVAFEIHLMRCAMFFRWDRQCIASTMKYSF